jgi:hypothetical protein
VPFLEFFSMRIAPAPKPKFPSLGIKIAVSSP